MPALANYFSHISSDLLLYNLMELNSECACIIHRIIRDIAPGAWPSKAREKSWLDSCPAMCRLKPAPEVFQRQYEKKPNVFQGGFLAIKKATINTAFVQSGILPKNQVMISILVLKIIV
jgi:hypothetical protein